MKHKKLTPKKHTQKTTVHNYIDTSFTKDEGT